LLAGRDEILDQMVEGLQAGPGSRYFGMAVVGERGVGKTVLLGAIEQRVSTDLKWRLVQEQALPQTDLISMLVERVATTAGPWWRLRRAFKEMEREYAFGANLGVFSATATAKGAPSAVRPERLLEQILVTVGEAAQGNRSGVLVTVDEAHVVDRAGLAVLGKIMQLVARRRGLPVAITLAGLPELRQHFRGGGTYLERLEVAELGHLDVTATKLALLKPAIDRGVNFEDVALERLVDASSGYPYLIQLLGYEAWTIAGGTGTITGRHASAAVDKAHRRMSDLYQARWDAIPEREHDYLHAVAMLGPGPAAVADVARRLDATGKSLSPRRQYLIEQRLIRPAGFGKVELTVPGLRAWILENMAR
jgi:hypothetical protein